jgi:ketosteroid isomerase-like protein
MFRERNIETARNVFRLLEQRKFKEFSELFTENGKWIHPYHSGLIPAELIGWKEIEKGLKKSAVKVDEIHFSIDEVLPFEDPNKIAVKLAGKLSMKNGGTYDNDYFCIFSFDEQGKILEWIEYSNPITAARAFDLMDKLK